MFEEGRPFSEQVLMEGDLNVAAKNHEIDQQEARKHVINRLKTIRGHISGIEKMIEEGKGCDEVLLQVTAVKSSIHKVGMLIMEEHALSCLFSDEEELNKEKMEQILKTIIHYNK